MVPLSLLNWTAMALSLFNTILMLWLGLTILLNTERFTWGVWLTGGGLLLSGAFFVSHSAILGYGLSSINRELDFWWRVGWLPVIVLPQAWYLAILWYAGFWRRSDSETAPVRSDLRRRQRLWLAVTVLLAVLLLGLLVFANPLPSYMQVAQLNLSETPSVGGMPLLILIYPFFILLCISLSLDALRRPAPSERIMGEVARRRAWPWLVASSLVLLLVSLLVGWIMVWIILTARHREVQGMYISMTRTVIWFDLIIAGLIAVAVILVGRAVVSYEVFTGRTLPRRGFFRHWRSVVIFAAGYGLVVGGSITFQLRPIYSLLLTTVLMTAFYSLFSWRAYAERERYIRQLRPFVASQNLYEHLLTPTTASLPAMDAATPFQALCTDVLGARRAYLAAVGPLAPLAGSILTYPEDGPVTLPALGELTAQFDSPERMFVATNPARYHGAIWAIPLWSARGLIGVLLLGEKRDNGLYTQEEFEIARASGERLIDTQASAEMARRLMNLQRRRLAESQILDHRTRRALHDEILPALHTAMLTLSSEPQVTATTGPLAETVSLLGEVHHRISDLLRELPLAVEPQVRKLGLAGALYQTVTVEFAGAFDRLHWHVPDQAEACARTIPPLTAEVIFYAAREVVRNAAHHGRMPGSDQPLTLIVSLDCEDGLRLCLEDDGVGLEGAAPSSGSGQGLALHSTMMAVIGGALVLESVPQAYTRVTLILPKKAWA